jgi:hypothetical protein
VDQAHSSIGFTIRFLGVTKVRGSFRDYAAAILFDEKDPTRSSATVVIDAGSIDTGLEERDKDLKGPKFFDVEKYPKIVFTSRSVEKTGPDRYVVRGSLEIRGDARDIAIPMMQTVPRMVDTAWGQPARRRGRRGLDQAHRLRNPRRRLLGREGALRRGGRSRSRFWETVSTSTSSASTRARSPRSASRSRRP